MCANLQHSTDAHYILLGNSHFIYFNKSKIPQHPYTDQYIILYIQFNRHTLCTNCQTASHVYVQWYPVQANSRLHVDSPCRFDGQTMMIMYIMIHAKSS